VEEPVHGDDLGGKDGGYGGGTEEPAEEVPPSVYVSIQGSEAKLRERWRSTYHPAKKPRALPYLAPAVTLAQWYTPEEEGMAEAISAMHAAIMKYMQDTAMNA
jgi:hypothetical protein